MSSEVAGNLSGLEQARKDQTTSPSPYHSTGLSSPLLGADPRQGPCKPWRLTLGSLALFRAHQGRDKLTPSGAQSLA